MTIKEFKIQRALGTAENSYSIRPDEFFGRVEFNDEKLKFNSELITIPYWLACKIRDLRSKDLPSHDLLFDYIEAQLL